MIKSTERMPSGEDRPAEQAAMIRQLDREEHGIWTTLPYVPNTPRLKDLMDNWVLEQNLDLSSAQQRLWASLKQHPDLLNLIQRKAFKTGNGPMSLAQKQAQRLLRQRDNQGRSLKGFVSVNAEAEVRQKTFVLPNLDAQGRPESWDREKRGLIHQCLLAPRADPFHQERGTPYFKRAMNLDERLSWNGAVEWENEWPRLFIDILMVSTRPPSDRQALYDVAMEVLAESPHRRPLQQAYLLSTTLEILENESGGWMPMGRGMPLGGFTAAGLLSKDNLEVFEAALLKTVRYFEQEPLVLSLEGQEWMDRLEQATYRFKLNASSHHPFLNLVQHVEQRLRSFMLQDSLAVIPFELKAAKPKPRL